MAADHGGLLQCSKLLSSVLPVGDGSCSLRPLWHRRSGDMEGLSARRLAWLAAPSGAPADSSRADVHYRHRYIMGNVDDPRDWYRLRTGCSNPVRGSSGAVSADQQDAYPGVGGNSEPGGADAEFGCLVDDPCS